LRHQLFLIPGQHLKKRELSFEKNRIFEEQKTGALERMRNINIELDNSMKEVGKDLQKKELTALLEFNQLTF